jgi:hypothetical protein
MPEIGICRKVEFAAKSSLPKKDFPMTCDLLRISDRHSLVSIIFLPEEIRSKAPGVTAVPNAHSAKFPLDNSE